jgi:hypothetical protein
MPRYLIQRYLPGASRLTDDEVGAIALTCQEAVESLGVPYTWVTSYVAGDTIYDVHEAEDEEAVVEQARRGGFPGAVVMELTREFGPLARQA